MEQTEKKLPSGAAALISVTLQGGWGKVGVCWLVAVVVTVEEVTSAMQRDQEMSK